MQVKVRIEDRDRTQAHGARTLATPVPVAQVHPMGCAVACVAFVLHQTYEEALELFDFSRRAWSEGFLCADVTTALARGGKPHTVRTILDPQPREEGITAAPSLVFISPSPQHPSGHFLAWCSENKKWMDPWINFPRMDPAVAGFRANLPGDPQYWFYAVKALKPSLLR